MALAVTSACSFHGLRVPHRPDYGGPIECSEDIGVPIFDTTWALGTLAATALVYQDIKEDRGSSDRAISQAAPLVLASALGMISAGYGYVMVSRCKRAKALDVIQRAEAKQRRRERKEAMARAWILTKEAETAARSGDCATVAKLDAQVGQLDDDFHTTVFLGDVAIARCLGAVQAPAEPEHTPVRTQPPTNDETQGPVEVPPPDQVPLPVPP